jgi:gluconolactonase
MRTVYVADTIQARIYAVDRKLEAQRPRLVATVPGMVTLDSLAMTAAGNICVATIGERGAISTVTPLGHLSWCIPLLRPFQKSTAGLRMSIEMRAWI